MTQTSSKYPTDKALQQHYWNGWNLAVTFATRFDWKAAKAHAALLQQAKTALPGDLDVAAYVDGYQDSIDAATGPQGGARARTADEPRWTSRGYVFDDSDDYDGTACLQGQIL